MAEDPKPPNVDQAPLHASVEAPGAAQPGGLPPAEDLGGAPEAESSGGPPRAKTTGGGQRSESPGGPPADESPGKGAEKPRVVRGRVSALIKAGFEVELADGREGVCSLSQMEPGRVQDASAYLQRDLDFVVVGRDSQTGRVRLSHRKVIERQAQAERSALLERIVPKARLRGRVARLTDFGAFIDLGGLEGLVHLSEISHRRINHPAEALAVGEEVEVLVLRVDRRGTRKKQDRGRDRRADRNAARRIGLSVKQAQEDPWKSIAERFSPWQVVDGRVTRVTDFGAFLEIAPGIEGLLHASEVPSGALVKIEEAARGGALMTVLVLHVDRARQRVSLAAAPGGLGPGDRIEPVTLREGKSIVGRVEEIQSGAVVLRLGPGQLGIIPDPEMGTSRGADHRSEFPLGTEIEAEVMRVESGGRRARLSRKRLLRREERAEVARHMRSQSDGGLSTLGDLLERARAKRDDPS